jgi:hypothetical protein
MVDVGRLKSYKALVFGVGLAAVLAAGLIMVVVGDRATAALPGTINGRIAFSSNRISPDNFDIYTINSNGTALVQVTNHNNPALDLYADWGARAK